MEIEIVKTNNSRLSEVDFDNLQFGNVFSDHIFFTDFQNGKWGNPKIVPYGPMELYPSLCSLHYGQTVFEGLKAFYTDKGINIFRFQNHHARLNHSNERLCIPEIGFNIFDKGLKELIKLDEKWVPKKRGYSLYLRPFVFATDNFLGIKSSLTFRFVIITSPVGNYYKEGMNPISLITSGEYVRAVIGGLGEVKTAANYAASLYPSEKAKKRGFTQVLWLDGLEKKYIDEVGTTNIFFLIDDELVTPPLEGSILAGITRDSVITIAKDWGMKVTERRISIDEVMEASEKKILREVFGTGTAAVISPVGEIEHNGKRITINNNNTGEISKKLYDEITAIQYGEKEDKFGWCNYI